MTCHDCREFDDINLLPCFVSATKADTKTRCLPDHLTVSDYVHVGWFLAMTGNLYEVHNMHKKTCSDNSASPFIFSIHIQYKITTQECSCPGMLFPIALCVNSIIQAYATFRTLQFILVLHSNVSKTNVWDARFFGEMWKDQIIEFAVITLTFLNELLISQSTASTYHKVEQALTFHNFQRLKLWLKHLINKSCIEKTSVHSQITILNSKITECKLHAHFLGIGSWEVSFVFLTGSF
jgi:hypothetical protein